MINEIKSMFKKNNYRSEITNREKLLKIINDNGLYGIETENSSDIKQILMKSRNIDDILKFAKENNINTIFFEYYYYNKDYFKIELEKYEEEYPEEIINIIKKDIIEYNNKIDKIDFETPIKLLVYCLYNGYSVAIEQRDEWGECYKEDIVSGEDEMEIIFETYQNRLEAYITEKEKQKEIELENLKEIIFDDEQFQRSTNKELRYAYINTFLKKNCKYLYLFGEHGTGAYRWIETIWREYKDMKKDK